MIIEEDLVKWTWEELLKELSFSLTRVNYLLHYEKKITPEINTTLQANTLEPKTTPRENIPELTDLPLPIDYPKTKEYSKELGSLVKYYSEESKYNSENDNFDFKLTIFYDLCTKAAIPKVALA